MSSSPPPSRGSSAGSHVSVPSTAPPTSPAPLPQQPLGVPLEDLPSAPPSASAPQEASRSGSDSSGHRYRSSRSSASRRERGSSERSGRDEGDEEGWPDDGASYDEAADDTMPSGSQQSDTTSGAHRGDGNEDSAAASTESAGSGSGATTHSTKSTSVSASAAPIDAPLLVPDWLPPPPSSSTSQAEDADTDVDESPSRADEEGAQPAFLLQPARVIDADDAGEDGSDKDGHSSGRPDDATVVDSHAASAAVSGAGAGNEEVRGDDAQFARASLPGLDTASDASTVVDATPAPAHAAEEDAGEGAGLAASDGNAVGESGAAAASPPASATTPVASHASALDDEQEQDAVLAASAAAITAEAVDDGVWASEDRASAALQLFSMTLHSKLVEQLIDDAAVAVGRTLQDTVQQHADRVRALMAHNRVLDRQLAGQAEQMQSIRGELEDSLLRDLQRVLSVDLRQALRAASSRGESQTTADTGVGVRSTTPPPSASRRSSPSSQAASHAGAEEDASGRDRSASSTGTRRESFSSYAHSSASSASSGSATPADARAAAAVSVEDLVAVYVQHRSTVELLERERAQWRASLSALHDRLRAAAGENAMLRREVERLRTSTVALDEHRAAVDGRAEAEHTCTLLRLELAKHAEQAGLLEALVARGGGELAAAAAATQQPTPQQQQPASLGASQPQPAAAHADAGADAEALRKGPQWDLAWRELEEQATIAANSRHLREQLTSAEAQLHAAQVERDASDAYATAFKAEGDVLRADLQSLVYRNSVLSQQVASLLVKVEEAAARLRQAQAQSTAQPQQLRDASAARRKGSSGRWPADTAAAPSPASPSSRSALAALSIATSSRRESSGSAGSGRLSALPSAAERRSAWLKAMWGPQTHGGGAGGSAAAATSSAASATLLDNATPLLLRGTSSLTSSYLSDSRAAAALAAAPIAEVEEGVQQRLSVFAASRVATPRHYSRTASLRQLGSPVCDVERASSPQLPASDQLSGCARGRPSTFSVVNRSSGTVTRQVGGEEVTAPMSEPRVHSVGELSRDPDLLRMLDTLDKDESLDRFSVNSVAELVVRNQELVQQLYEATQRAAAAEQQQHRAPGQTAQDVKAVPAQATTTTAAASACSSASTALRGASGEGSSSRATQLPASLAAAPAALMAQADEGAAAAPASRKRTRGEDSDATAEAARDASAAPPPTTAVAVAPSGGVEAESWFGRDASDAVASMVDAITRRREVRLTAADADVSRALLAALAAQRAADAAVEQARTTSSQSSPGSLEEGAEAGVAAEVDALSPSPFSARSMAACVRGLLQLCVRQSAALAEVALTAAEEQREVQLAVKDTWTEMQRTLLAALQTSQAATAPHSAVDETGDAAAAMPLHQRVRPEGMPRDGDASSIATATRLTDPHARGAPHEFRPEEQTALLQQLRALLHTAARKDETLLHVYQAAQSRQDARQRQQKEQLTRLLLKLERKRRLIKALQQQQQQRPEALSVVAGAEAAVTGSVRPARGLSHPSQPEGEPSSQSVAAVGGGFRLSPQPGSPKWRTPPMVLPAPNTGPHPHASPRTNGGGGVGGGNEVGDSSDGGSDPDTSVPRGHGGGADDVHRGGPDDEHSSAVDGTDSDDDDDVLRLDLFRELQQQLALSQANHRAAQEELDAEKTRHTALLERMWVLETARDDAVAAVAGLEARMADMIPRSAHEDVEVELQAAKSALQARDAELHEARATHRELQEQLEEQRAQAEAQQREVKIERGGLEEAARLQEQRLASAKDLARQLQDQLSNARRHACDVEETIAYLRIELATSKDAVVTRDALIEELKDQLLMRADVQDLLHRLYPGDAVLHANAQLVRRLSEAHTRLQLQQAETQQELSHTRAELQQREMGVREAIQDRQAAEVRLQDALSRLAAWQDTDGEGPSTQATATDGDGAQLGRPHTTAPSAGHPQTADAAARMAALFDVEAAPLAALRQRVRYLNACVAAQANDIAVLRAAEAAWKSREDDLRRQLEVMSADPVSLTARRYGLSACLTFQAQLEAMQQRQDALQASLEQLCREKADVEATVQAHARAAAAAAEAEAAAAAESQRLVAQLETVTATCAAQAANLAALEAAQKSAEAQRASLEQQCNSLSTELGEVRRSLEEAQASLQSTVTQRDQFWKDNHLLITKVEELEKALLKSDAEKLKAKEALAQGLSASQLGAHRRRGGGGGGADSSADRYRGHASLTQDFSLSSLMPHSP